VSDPRCRACKAPVVRGASHCARCGSAQGMPLAHMALLVFGAALIVGMFMVASRAPNDAELEYRPYAPAAQDQVSAAPVVVGRPGDEGDKMPMPTREPSADTLEWPLKGASAARP